jgi:hypothetical protein
MEAERDRAIGVWCSLGSKRSLQRRNDEQYTSQAMKKKKNGLRIILRDRLLGQESELKMQRQRFSKSERIRDTLKSRD